MVEKNRNGLHTSDPMLDTIKNQLYAKVEPTEKLGAYIQGVLLNRQWTVEDLAGKLGYQTTLFLRAVIKGEIPEETIDDEFIENLGRVIDRSPNVIRVILGRKPQDGTHLDTLLAEQVDQSEEMIAKLLTVLPQRYESEVTRDVHRAKQYDFVIKQIEKFIARQKQELDAATRLVQQLQEDDPDESMKIDLRRIISRIIADEPESIMREVRELEVLMPRDKPNNTRKP